MPETIDTASDRVWQVVAAIPRGRVATYGQIAGLAGIPAHARLVGRILSRLPNGSRLPWHRVITSDGRLKSPNSARQRDRLADEGVPLTNGRVRLKQYQWQP